MGSSIIILFSLLVAAPAPMKPDHVEGGMHWRFECKSGVVHAWTPPGFNPASAGTVVYVHGYYTDADGAWRDHHLAQQFRASRQNALFVVPAAQQGDLDPVKFDRLSVLLREVARHLHLPTPNGHVVAMVHSGGFRTVLPWLEFPLLDHVILLDALYAGEERFFAWATTDEGHEPNKLTIVGQDTALRTEPILKSLTGVTFRKKIPDSFADFSQREKRARILYMHAQYNHTEMVAGGRVIPVVLRRAPLTVVYAAPAKPRVAANPSPAPAATPPPPVGPTATAPTANRLTSAGPSTDRPVAN